MRIPELHSALLACVLLFLATSVKAYDGSLCNGKLAPAAKWELELSSDGFGMQMRQCMNGNIQVIDFRNPHAFPVCVRLKKPNGLVHVQRIESRESTNFSWQKTATTAGWLWGAGRMKNSCH